MRLIDADAFFEDFPEARDYEWVSQEYEVDAVPVVRCGECRWYRKEYGWNCIEYTVCGISPTHHPIRTEDDFCSYGERRNDG